MGEGEDGGDAGIAGEKFTHEIWAVALAAAMKEDDVAWKSIRAAG